MCRSGDRRRQRVRGSSLFFCCRGQGYCCTYFSEEFTYPHGAKRSRNALPDLLGRRRRKSARELLQSRHFLPAWKRSRESQGVSAILLRSVETRLRFLQITTRPSIA